MNRAREGVDYSASSGGETERSLPIDTGVITSSRPGPNRLRGTSALLIALSIPLLAALFFWKYTVDDTYISLRFAHNLAAGNGMVFNIGERVEGYSCPLWVVMLGLAERLGADPVIASKTISLLSALGLILLLNVVLRRSLESAFIASFATIWFAVLPGLHIYACSGMETLPFALAVATATSLPVLVSSPRGRAIAMPLGLLLVATLRPEGLMLCVLLSLLWLATEKKRQIRIGLILALVVLAGLFIVRHHYYGAFLPNTYLAKPSPVPHELASKSMLGKVIFLCERLISNETLRPILQRVGGLGLVLCAFLALLARPRSPLTPACLVSVLTGAAFLFYAPEDWMPADRFAIPFAFPLIALAAIGLHSIRLSMSEAGYRRLRLALVLFLVVWSGTRLRDTATLMHELAMGLHNAALDGRDYVEIGQWLAREGRPGERLLAYEVGAVGYYSRLPVIDHEGLITRAVAEIIAEAGGYDEVRTGEERAAMARVVRYCVDQEPDWFLVRSTTQKPLRLGEPVPEGVAREAIQNALLREFGESMTLAEIFLMGERYGHSEDKYLLLRRTRPLTSMEPRE